MQGADIAIVVLAVVSVAGSIVGIAAYEPDAVPSWIVDVATQTSDADVQVMNQQVGGGGAEATWELTAVNVTRVEFEVRATGGQARLQPTSVTVTITSPTGEARDATVTLQPPNTNSVTATIVFEAVAPTPQGGTTMNATSEEARMTVPENRNGTGNWTIEATRTAGLTGENPTVVVTMTSYAFYHANVRPEGADLGEAV